MFKGARLGRVKTTLTFFHGDIQDKSNLTASVIPRNKLVLIFDMVLQPQSLPQRLSGSNWYGFKLLDENGKVYNCYDAYGPGYSLDTMLEWIP